MNRDGSGGIGCSAVAIHRPRLWRMVATPDAAPAVRTESDLVPTQVGEIEQPARRTVGR
jgi:hypothetical protein